MARPKIIAIRGGFPDPPTDLDATGRSAWDLGIPLWLEGALIQRDLVNWKLFCEAMQEKAHCERILKRQKEYSVAMNGCYVQHPAIKRRQQAEAVIRKYSQAFGLLPEARKKRPSAKQVVATRAR